MPGPHSPRWRALIVDDERIARLSLRALLEGLDGVEVVGEAGSAAEGATLVPTQKPNLVFLDIQMPGADGFELAEKLDPKIPVVFVTASDRFAVRAFEVNALDYLVKPVEPARLQLTLRKLGKLSATSPVPTTPAGSGDVLFLPMEKSRVFVPLDRVVGITSQRNNSRVRLNDGRVFIVRRSLQQWTRFLDGRVFARVNRHRLVHLKFLQSFERNPTGTARIRIEGEEKPESVSRRLAAPLQRLLKSYRGG